MIGRPRISIDDLPVIVLHPSVTSLGVPPAYLPTEPAGREYVVVSALSAVAAMALAAGGWWLLAEMGRLWSGSMSMLWAAGFVLVAVRAAAVFVRERHVPDAASPAAMRA
jgi:hypothetical protein